MRAKGYVRNQVIRRGLALLVLLGMVAGPFPAALAQSGRQVTRPRVVAPRPPAEPSPAPEGEDTAPSTSRPRPSLGRRGEDAPRPSVPSPSARPPAADVDDDIITIQATLVTIPVIVSDDYNRYLPFLRKNQFSLLEDNVPQEITFCVRTGAFSRRPGARCQPQRLPEH